MIFQQYAKIAQVVTTYLFGSLQWVFAKVNWYTDLFGKPETTVKKDIK